MAQGHIVVTGASGLVGRAAMEHFARAGYKVSAISRRAPFDCYGARHIPVDLADEAACRNALSSLGDVTQIVFAALHEEPDLVSGWTSEAHVARNAAMLRNTVEAIAPGAPSLRNVTVLQGPKAYGAHVRLMKIGAREDRDEDRSIQNFYWAQEDYIRDRAHGQNWGWTILRPCFVMGMAVGGAMNLIGAIGLYAALLRHRGEPLHFPGSRGGISQPTDTDLMARAIEWAGHAEAARNQVFNIANGDLFSLAEMWPVIADALGMPVGDDRPFPFVEQVPRCASEWDEVRRQHGLIAPDAEEFLGQSAQFADWIFARASAGLRGSISTVKIQNAGFTEAMHSEDMFRKWIGRYQQARLIPPRG